MSAGILRQRFPKTSCRFKIDSEITDCRRRSRCGSLCEAKMSAWYSYRHLSLRDPNSFGSWQSLTLVKTEIASVAVAPSQRHMYCHCAVRFGSPKQSQDKILPYTHNDVSYRLTILESYGALAVKNLLSKIKIY
jgi:hypothetical protein